MALKRYIGPHAAVEVRIAGRDFGVVARDEAIALPPELAKLLDAQPDLWADVVDDKPLAAKAVKEVK